MDIHRCRFVQYPPQPINALAFSHASDPKKKTPVDLRLALGRNNGDIEIWNPSNGLWLQETTLKGSKSTTIEQLAWTQDLAVHDQSVSRGPLRLFSTNGSTAITEWDLCTGAPRRKTEGNFGDIWCFAAQPQMKENEVSDGLFPGTGSQLLAAGCIDGTVILFSTEDDDLRYVRAIVQPPVKKPKVLSLAWRDRATIVAGYEDSTIRIIDVPGRKIIRNMSLGKPVDGNNSVVWVVKCLPDGTIVSGDSSGELKIWDRKNFSLVQRLNTHKADILDIAASASGDTLVSVGVDRRTIMYNQAPIQSGSHQARWGEIAHKRYHQHDVKCAVSFESKEMSVLVSGGMDSRPVVVPIRRFQTEYHRGLPYLPQKSQISASKTSRLFISWWGQEIVVYNVPTYQGLHTDVNSPEGSSDQRYETLTRLVLQDDANIQDAQISEDGQFILAATINGVKMFQLRRTQISGKPGLRTRQIELPHSMAHLGGRWVGFSPDGKWLFCIRKDNAVALAKIVLSDDTKDRPTIHEKLVKLYRQPRNRSLSILRSYDQTITEITFSSDSRVLAVGDISGAIDVWLLEGHEDSNFIDESASDKSSDNSSDSSSSTDDEDDDSYSPIIHGQKWIRNPSGPSLPQLDSAILALTFRPSSSGTASQSSTHDNLGLHVTRRNPHPVTHELPSASSSRLLAITAKHQLVEFEVLSSKLSDWSRRNPSKYLPHNLTRIKDRVVGCFWDCSDTERKGERLWLYGSTWVFMLDVSRDLLKENGATSSPTGKAEVEKVGRLGRYDVLEPVINGANVDSTHSNRKRQKLISSSSHYTGRDQKHPKKKRFTGAGDAIRTHERQLTVPRPVRKFSGLAEEDAEMIDVSASDAYEDEDMELDDELDETLALMRRGAESKDSTTQSTSTEITKTTQRPRSRWRHWHTFEYNSILGIAVIGGPAPSSGASTMADSSEARSLTSNEQKNEDASSHNIEVIIVERPLHDVEQVPRFDGGQDWEA